MKLKLFLLTALSVIGLMLPSASLANSPLSVRLGQPKSPTNQNNFKITFVVFQAGGSDNITVDCYKKYSSDSDYSRFDGKILIPGGNTDYCTVDSNILNTSGTYSFKIVANGVESNIVTVDYSTSGPSTPNSYSKERINTCEYKIKFKTADDSKTAKVELFRSGTTTIDVNPSGRVSTLDIGPITEAFIINSIPDCEKDFYYVIRAVDVFGNVSGTTGDSFTTTLTVNPTGTTQGAIPVQGSLTGNSKTGLTATPSIALDENGNPITSTTTPSPEVLGTQTSKWNWLKWLIIPLVVVVGLFLRKGNKRA